MADHQVRWGDVPFRRFGEDQGVSVRAQRRLTFPPRRIGLAQIFSKGPLVGAFIPSGLKQIARAFASPWTIAIPQRLTRSKHHQPPISAQGRRPFVHSSVDAAQGHWGRPCAVLLFEALKEVLTSRNSGKLHFLNIGDAMTGEHHPASREVKGAVIFFSFSVKPALKQRRGTVFLRLGQRRHGMSQPGFHPLSLVFHLGCQRQSLVVEGAQSDKPFVILAALPLDLGQLHPAKRKFLTVQIQGMLQHYSHVIPIQIAMQLRFKEPSVNVLWTFPKSPFNC